MKQRWLLTSITQSGSKNLKGRSESAHLTLHPDDDPVFSDISGTLNSSNFYTLLTLAQMRIYESDEM